MTEDQNRPHQWFCEGKESCTCMESWKAGGWKDTPTQRLLDTLRELQHPGDPEIAHALADKALLEYIDDPEITKAFENIEKWYA